MSLARFSSALARRVHSPLASHGPLASAASRFASSTTTSPPFVVFVSVKIKPEHTDEFLKAMAIDAAGSRTEKGCFRFDLLKCKSQPDTYYFYEAYTDSGPAMDFHKATPHYKAWADFKDKYGVVSQEVIKADGIDFTL